MRQPPPFWNVVIGAGTIAVLGVAVIATLPDQTVVGWVLIGLAVLAVIIYVVWLLIWIWRHRGGGATETHTGTGPVPPAINVNVPGNNNNVTIVVMQHLRETGPEVIEQQGAKLIVSAADDVLEIREEVTATVTRATVDPTGGLIVNPPAAESFVNEVIRSVFAQAQTAIAVGQAYNATVRIEESPTDPATPRSPDKSTHDR
jgi:hypothetical protein